MFAEQTKKDGFHHQTIQYLQCMELVIKDFFGNMVH